VIHTRFAKEDHLPDWARRDNKDTKGDRAELEAVNRTRGRSLENTRSVSDTL